MNKKIKNSTISSTDLTTINQHIDHMPEFSTVDIMALGKLLSAFTIYLYRRMHFVNAEHEKSGF